METRDSAVHTNRESTQGEKRWQRVGWKRLSDGGKPTGDDYFMKRLSLTTLATVCLVVTAKSQEVTNIDARADQLLRAACQYLAEAPFFSLTAEVWREHVNSSGEKLQFARTMNMEMVRPNRLHAELESAHSARGFWYDGKTLTVLDRRKNLYSTNSMPGTLDEALDAAHDQFGIDLPMIDLAISDPYKNAMARVVSSTGGCT